MKPEQEKMAREVVQFIESMTRIDKIEIKPMFIDDYEGLMLVKKNTGFYTVTIQGRVDPT